MWFQLWQFVKEYPNTAATIFGGIGTGAAWILGIILKRPLEKQAIMVTTFRAQIEGYDSLVKALQAQISYHEQRERIAVEYQDLLLARLQKAQNDLLARPV